MYMRHQSALEGSSKVAAARRGCDEEPSTPDKPGSPLLDLGSVQRLASRLNERIASEEHVRSPASRRSLSASPLVSPFSHTPSVLSLSCPCLGACKSASSKLEAG